MGYTIENKKIVIWTQTTPIAEPYPFNDEVTNYTFFFKNLYDKHPFCECLAVVSIENKEKLVSKYLNLKIGTFILKSKKSHHKQKAKRNGANRNRKVL